MFSSVGTHAATINSSAKNYKVGAAVLGLLGVAAIFVAAFAPISLLCAGICFGAGVLCLLGALWLLQKADAAGSSDEDESVLTPYTPPDPSDNESLPRSDSSDRLVEDTASISSEDSCCTRRQQCHRLFDEDADEFYSGFNSREASSSHLPGDHQEQAKLKHAIRELARIQKLTDYASSGLYMQYARDVLHRNSDSSLEQEPVMQWLKQLADANELATDEHVRILWGCFAKDPRLAEFFADRIKIFQGECGWSKPQLEKLSEICKKYELNEMRSLTGQIF